MSDWETEAIRSAHRFGRIAMEEDPTRPRTATGVRTKLRQDESLTDWVTLRLAHALTSIPVETVREWARRGNVTSYLDERGPRKLRMVSLADVLARAKALGREVSPVEPIVIDDSASSGRGSEYRDVPERSKPSVRGTAPPRPRPVIRTATSQPDDEPTDGIQQRDTPIAGESTMERSAGVPEGTTIVPIAAWDKMLIQLGNLHEAGQQLAKALERAARAETEAHFLRERLAEMRAERGPQALSPGEPVSHTRDTADSLERGGVPGGGRWAATRDAVRSRWQWDRRR